MRAFLPVFGAALLLAFWVYALIDCIRTDEFRARGLPKGAWVFVIIILPLIGGILWFTIGKARMPRAGSTASNRRPLYPDDDPALVRGGNTGAEREQGIRDREAKLAELDDGDLGGDTLGGDDKPGNSGLKGTSDEPKGE